MKTMDFQSIVTEFGLLAIKDIINNDFILQQHNCSHHIAQSTVEFFKIVDFMSSIGPVETLIQTSWGVLGVSWVIWCMMARNAEMRNKLYIVVKKLSWT